MKLRHDWKAILQKAWSIRLMLIVAVFSGLEVAMPLLNGLLPVPPALFAVLSGLTVMGAVVARLLQQSTNTETVIVQTVTKTTETETVEVDNAG